MQCGPARNERPFGGHSGMAKGQGLGKAGGGGVESGLEAWDEREPILENMLSGLG